MKILSVFESETSLSVQSINGILFIEEDWMKKSKEKTSKKHK